MGQKAGSANMANSDTEACFSVCMARCSAPETHPSLSLVGGVEDLHKGSQWRNHISIQGHAKALLFFCACSLLAKLGKDVLLIHLPPPGSALNYNPVPSHTKTSFF